MAGRRVKANSDEFFFSLFSSTFLAPYIISHSLNQSGETAATAWRIFCINTHKSTTRERGGRRFLLTRAFEIRGAWPRETDEHTEAAQSKGLCVCVWWYNCIHACTYSPAADVRLYIRLDASAPVLFCPSSYTWRSDYCYSGEGGKSGGKWQQL